MVMSYDIKYWIFVIDFLLVGHFTLFSLLWGGFLHVMSVWIWDSYDVAF
jgi:hypothetical protein